MTNLREELERYRQQIMADTGLKPLPPVVVSRSQFEELYGSARRVEAERDEMKERITSYEQTLERLRVSHNEVVVQRDTLAYQNRELRKAVQEYVDGSHPEDIAIDTYRALELTPVQADKLAEAQGKLEDVCRQDLDDRDPDIIAAVEEIDEVKEGRR